SPISQAHRRRNSTSMSRSWEAWPLSPPLSPGVVVRFDHVGARVTGPWRSPFENVFIRTYPSKVRLVLAPSLAHFAPFLRSHTPLACGYGDKGESGHRLQATLA